MKSGLWDDDTRTNTKISCKKRSLRVHVMDIICLLRIKLWS